jgi:O-antigen ligase
MTLLRPLAATPRPRAEPRAADRGGLNNLDLAVWATAALVAVCVAVSLPVAVAGVGLGAYGWRIGAVILAFAMLGCVGFRLAVAMPLFIVCAPWMTAITILAALRLDQPQVWLEWARHLFMLLVGGCVFAGSQAPLGRLLLGRTMVVLFVCLLALAIPPAVTVLLDGWTWEAARRLKAETPSGLSLNSFMFLFGLVVCALWIQIGPRKTWFAAAGAFAVACVIFASRAPLAAAVIAAALVTGFSAWRGGRRLSTTGAAALAGAVLLLPLGFIVLAVATPDSALGHALAGRAQLWQISLTLFTQHPLIGAGPEALAMGVRGEINAGSFFADWQRENLFSLANGGFHNIWLDALASKGVVGFLGLLGSYFLLMRTALAGAAGGARALLFFTLLLFGRGYVEVSGLFSYENSPHDFIAFILVAWALAAALNEPAGASTPASAAEARPSRRGLMVRPHGR